MFQHPCKLQGSKTVTSCVSIEWLFQHPCELQGSKTFKSIPNQRSMFQHPCKLQGSKTSKALPCGSAFELKYETYINCCINYTQKKIYMRADIIATYGL